MFSPDQIEALRIQSGQIISPVIEFLISDIASRIAEAGQLTSTAAYQIWRAQNLGLSQRQLKKELRKRLKVSHRELRKLLTQAAEVGYDFDIKRFPFVQAVPFDENESLQRIVQTAADMADENLTNLTQTMGFVTYDGKVTELTEAYRKSCDFAFEKIFTGAQDYNSAIRQATKGLAEKGIQTIDYESGVHRSMEAAVRGSFMGGLGIMQEEISQQNHDDLGCDGWEISAHAGSAPDHEPYQGKQYSDAEFTRLNNSLKRRIGTLNCGHSAMPIIMGINDPQYTPEELEAMCRENEQGINYDGKHYTLHEATQRQRGLERTLRKQKRKILIDEKTGDEDKLAIDQTRYVVANDEYHRFSKAAGLRLQHERANVPGFGAKQHSAAVKVASKAKVPETINSAPQDNLSNKYASKIEGSSKASGVQRVVKQTVITDVTDEYLNNATPGIGKITFEEGYDKNGHRHEVSFAEWLKNNFGGDIVVQNESTKDGEKRSDYLWNNRLWELKAPTSAKAPDSALRKALAQILPNPGGVILDFKDCKIEIDEALVTIDNRMTRTESIDTDIMIIHKGKLIKAVRYKKMRHPPANGQRNAS